MDVTNNVLLKYILVQNFIQYINNIIEILVYVAEIYDCHKIYSHLSYGQNLAIEN